MIYVFIVFYFMIGKNIGMRIAIWHDTYFNGRLGIQS